MASKETRFNPSVVDRIDREDAARFAALPAEERRRIEDQEDARWLAQIEAEDEFWQYFYEPQN
jgi:hypothetical protein